MQISGPISTSDEENSTEEAHALASGELAEEGFIPSEAYADEASGQEDASMASDMEVLKATLYSRRYHVLRD